jgi:hypothetical protein
MRIPSTRTGANEVDKHNIKGIYVAKSKSNDK